MSDNLVKPWTFENPLCREIGGDMFYMADKDDPQYLENNQPVIQEAKKICNGCEHKVDCLLWGVHHESYGVWGGVSPKELSDIRNRQKIPLKSLTLFGLGVRT